MRFGGIRVRKPRHDFRGELRAFRDVLAPLKNSRGKCQAGFFVAFAAIGFIEQLEQFHEVVHTRHFFPHSPDTVDLRQNEHLPIVFRMVWIKPRPIAVVKRLTISALDGVR
jgi:hypothetical protein